MSEDKNRNSYIEGIEEWQDNQYNPGYYLGGKVPGNLLYSGRPVMIGISIIGIGLMTLIPLILCIINTFRTDESILPIEYALRFLQVFGLGAFSLVMIENGIKKIMRAVKIRNSK